jgi:hypothetical protein
LVTPGLINHATGEPVTDPDVLARFHASQTAPTGASDQGKEDNKRDRANDKNESPAFDPHNTVIRSAERAQQVKTAAVVAFVPPVIVIALGAALGWAINGFRQ